MYDKLIFYCHFGAGDLFESREFVKEIMRIIPAGEYFYAHGKSPRMFLDIPELKYMTVTPEMSAVDKFKIDGNTLYINTWIGRDGRYVLPQVGCVIDKNYEMFNDILTGLGYPNLSKPYLEYLPVVDFSYFYTEKIDEFLPNMADSLKVLVCNGPVQSSQAENFNFDIPIRLLAEEHPEVSFIVTELTQSLVKNNITSTSRIIQHPSYGFDLNEISYLAKFCDIIIGRKSGPFVFAHNRDVWYNGNKKSLSFTYAKHSSHFVQEDTLPLRKYWSPATRAEDVVKEIERLL